MHLSNKWIESNRCGAIVDGTEYILEDDALLDADGFPLDTEYQSGVYGAKLKKIKAAMIAYRDGGK